MSRSRSRLNARRRLASDGLAEAPDDPQLLAVATDAAWRLQFSAEAIGYAHRWRADSETWRFLTGSMEDVRRVAGRFGVVYWAEEGAITHTSSTAIVDRDGRLRAVVEGSSFTSQQLIDLVDALRGEG